MAKKIFQVKFHTSVKIGAREELHVNAKEYNIELSDDDRIFSINHRRHETHWISKVPAVNAAWWREMSDEHVNAETPKFTETLTPESADKAKQFEPIPGDNMPDESVKIPTPGQIKRGYQRRNAQAGV